MMTTWREPGPLSRTRLPPSYRMKNPGVEYLVVGRLLSTETGE